jgi:hypothetical protein
VTSTTYKVPLDHFIGTTSNVVIVLDQLLVGSHTILPLQLTSSTMVPKDTHVFAESEVITQDPIGKPLPLISNPSLPPGYNALNKSIANPSQNPSGGDNLFVPPGYNVSSSCVSTPTEVLSMGARVPSTPSPGGSNHPSPSSSNQIGGTSHYVTSGIQNPIGGQPHVQGHLKLGGNLKLGSHIKFRGNFKLGGKIK